MAADADGEDYRAQIRVITQAMPAAVSISNAAGAVLWVNPFWSKLTGVSFDDSVGRGWHGSVHDDDLASLTTAFGAGLQHQQGRQRCRQCAAQVDAGDAACQFGGH